MYSQKILKYWKESFELLGSSQIKLISLAALNNFIRSTKLLIINFWWLILLEFFFVFSNLFISVGLINFNKSIWLFFTQIMIIFSYLLCCRASMERKDLVYFNQYFKALPLVFLLLLPNRIILLGAVPLVMAFFFLDSTLGIKGFCKSIKNGALFIIYFPVILIIDLIYWIFGAIITFSLFLPFSGTLFIPTEITLLDPTEIMLITISNLLMLILRFIQLSFIATFYLRIKHSFPDLFGAK
jgi:hypothetical protein